MRDNMLKIPDVIAQDLDLKPGTALDWRVAANGVILLHKHIARGERADKLLGIGRRFLKPGGDPVAELVGDRFEGSDDLGAAEGVQVGDEVGFAEHAGAVFEVAFGVGFVAVVTCLGVGVVAPVGHGGDEPVEADVLGQADKVGFVALERRAALTGEAGGEPVDVIDRHVTIGQRLGGGRHRLQLAGLGQHPAGVAAGGVPDAGQAAGRVAPPAPGAETVELPFGSEPASHGVAAVPEP